MIVLAILATLAWIPTHRNVISIRDPDEVGIPDDYDALLLEGRIEGDSFQIELVVAGTIQESGYNVNVVGRGPPYPEPHIYRLEYESGVEENYGIPVAKDGNTLRFTFPMSLLLEGAYIVGLEAVVFSTDTSDVVKEAPREVLRVPSVFPLPFNPVLLIAASITMASLSAWSLRKLILVNRKRGPQNPPGA